MRKIIQKGKERILEQERNSNILNVFVKKNNYFEIFNTKEKVFYIDWNIVRELKKKEIINKNRNMKIPFSSGHLRDLYQSYSYENWDKIREDLEYLSIISNDLELLTSDVEFNFDNKCDETIELIYTLLVKRSVYKEFQIILNKAQKEEELMGSELIDNYKKINITVDYKNDINLFEEAEAQRMFVANGNKIDENFIKKIMEFYIFNEDSIFENKIKYKEFRQLLQGKRTWSTSKEIIDFFNFFSETNIDNFKKNFIKNSEYFHKINGLKRDEFSSKTQEIEFMLLEFNPIFREKLKGKNKLSNIVRDFIHFQNALLADYFVSNDQNLIKKIAFLSNFYNKKNSIQVISQNELEDYLKKDSL